jgi:hypothetical protein
MFSEDEIEKLIDRFILLGLIDIVGVDSVTGEFLYQISPELNEMFPQIQNYMADQFLSEILSLWVKGFVAMDIAEESPNVSLTKLAFDEEKIAELTIEERNALFMIMSIMKKD